MRSSTLYGILLGTLAIMGSFLIEGGKTEYLFLLPPIIIVLGGTLAAGLAGHSFEVISRIPTLIKKVLNPPKYDIKGIIEELVKYSSIARKEGIFTLEHNIQNTQNPYMKKFIESVIDGADLEALNELIDIEIENISDRHSIYIGFFNKLGGYSPTMGIIGTVMGLIATLASVGSDPTVLIQNIATAFIATLWGIFMANIIWLPIADKLKFLHNEELRIINLIVNGVRAIQKGDVPTIVHSKLVSSLPLNEQKNIILSRVYKDESKREKVETLLADDIL